MSESVQQQCTATLVRRSVLGNMPVFNNPADYPGEYDPLTVSYYTEEVVPSLWPSIVGVAVFGVMWLVFVVWRCWRLCCLKRRTGKKQGNGMITRPLPFDVTQEGGCVPRMEKVNGGSTKHDPISMHASSSMSDVMGRNSRGGRSGRNVLVTCIFLMMCGVVGSCIYGIVATEQKVVSDAVDVVETSGRGYVESVLGDVQQTIDTGRDLDSTLSVIENLAQNTEFGLNIEGVDGIDRAVMATLSSIQGQLRDILVTAQNGVDQVEGDVIDRIDAFIEEYEPQVQQYNTYRSAVMYVLFSLGIVFSMCVFLNAVLVWPFLHSMSIFLLLCLMIINFAAVIAYTAGIKVGSDTCQNIEPFIIDQVDDPAATAVLRYYFNREGSVYDVAQQAANVDIQDITRTIEDTKQSVESLIQGVALNSELQGQVDLALGLADSMLESIDAAVQKLEAETVMTGPYLEVRGFVCCDTLDTVGDIWLSLVLVGVFSFLLLLFAFWLVYKFDRLPLKNWYGRYKPYKREFA